MAVSKRTRFEVLRRDNYTCRYCRSTDNPLTVDHVVPVALGGSDNPDNLVAACQDCNSGKAATSPDEGTITDVAEDVARWGRAMAQATQIRSGQRDELAGYVHVFVSHWDRWATERFNDSCHECWPLDWELTIGGFYELGLPSEDLGDSVKASMLNWKVMPNSSWRYMCGVAWKKLATLQDLARQQPEWTSEA